MARRKKNKEFNKDHLVSECKVIETEEMLLSQGYIFLKFKGNKKVYVKNSVRKQIDI